MIIGVLAINVYHDNEVSSEVRHKMRINRNLWIRYPLSINFVGLCLQTVTMSRRVNARENE
jgi:hypothetical protein